MFRKFNKMMREIKKQYNMRCIGTCIDWNSYDRCQYVFEGEREYNDSEFSVILDYLESIVSGKSETIKEDDTYKFSGKIDSTVYDFRVVFNNSKNIKLYISSGVWDAGEKIFK